jgi:hypothetical protein
MNTSPSPAVSALIQSSALWRWTNHAVAVLARAWQSSAVGSSLHRSATSARALTRADQLQSAALIIAVAAGVQGLFLATAPASLMTSIRWLWLVVALVAAVMAASAATLVKAWASSRCRAMWSAVHGQWKR